MREKLYLFGPIIMAAALLLAGCGEPVDNSTQAKSSNPAVVVTHLGDYDGCKMYAASNADSGFFMFYFVRCPHESTDASWTTGGKVEHHYSVRTVNQ